ncbi:hypothetical protein [Kaistia algarum]|uniref:hypothetical protein n=1 Tax=Kaistia algarum TaxID=2083279 RepID=UPI00105752A9|nr:hypothetical protein [Kaistia algarum]MCX5515076.1 hypothetical protein [Kaistia algarum]
MAFVMMDGIVVGTALTPLFLLALYAVLFQIPRDELEEAAQSAAVSRLTLASPPKWNPRWSCWRHCSLPGFPSCPVPLWVMRCDCGVVTGVNCRTSFDHLSTSWSVAGWREICGLDIAVATAPDWRCILAGQAIRMSLFNGLLDSFLPSPHLSRANIHSHGRIAGF